MSYYINQTTKTSSYTVFFYVGLLFLAIGITKTLIKFMLKKDRNVQDVSFRPITTTKIGRKEIKKSKKMVRHPSRANFCSNCGTRLSGQEHFCPSCGMRI